MDLSNENVIHFNKNGIEYLQFKKLLQYKDIVTHAYSLGVNVNFRTSNANRQPLKAEVYQKTLQDYKNLCNAINLNYADIVKCNQNHTSNVLNVERKINATTPDFNLENYDNTDGLITNKSNIILATTNADCILLMFFDPKKKVISNVHSGWKGTLQRISVNAVKKMHDIYGCEPKDIMCCICPSIRKCHFEVDKDVKDLFYNEFCKLNNIDDIIEEKNNKWNIDTVLINKTILLQEGLLEENIVDSGLCSVCNSEKIHSFRVEKEGYGLETALIGLK